MKVDLPLIGQSSPDETVQWLRVERINWYPESAPDARSPQILRTAAGLARMVSLGGGIIRGMRVMGDKLYCISGERLFQVNDDFTHTILGTILGGSRCVLVDTFIPDTSRQLIIGTGERGYVYDTVAGLTEITDTQFVTTSTKKTPVVSGGYVVWDTADGMMWSDLQDPLTYPPLNFRTAETVTDGVVGLALVYGDVWMGGQRSFEVVRLTGEANENAFALAQTIDYGIASPYAMINANNQFFFLESHARVYVASGFNCARASTFQIEQWLSSVDLSDAFMLSFVDRGHEFVSLTVPESKTENYDVATQIWSRRKSKDMERWKVNAQAQFNGQNIFGDFESGALRKLDASYVGEGDGGAFGDGEPELIRELITPYVHSDSDPIFHHTLDLVAQVGKAAQTGESVETDPVIEMRYSDKEGNWSNFKQKSIGKIGEYGKRVRWTRLGRSRSRVYHFRISDPVRCDLITATITADPGDQA